MRVQDRMAFAQAARTFNCWILVRRTNPDSLKYVGLPGYTPKPIDCKAKTANNPSHPLAGLVVDPVRVPQAFESDKLPKVKQCWEAFSSSVMGNGGRYAVVTENVSRHFGCVTLGGKFVHGDYDLKDIILADQLHRNLASVEMLQGQPHMRGPRVLQVQQFVNARIGADMVQHGGEAQFADHADEPIDCFGPDMSCRVFLNELAVRSWYHEINREVIDLKKHPASSSGAGGGFQGWTPRVIRGGKE